ncbi:hypothetical protein Pla163_26480 [Planctomycetes bacterium Pla163]|uniref:HEAT repeat protein n=1 Tax=Rohdeia mirabilis TaxID=2528008 RepID=A0A518D215_9BACT|nr:hypothetical protein Pla163_26480 [Planctomycetes bacterium Pla163]
MVRPAFRHLALSVALLPTLAACRAGDGFTSQPVAATPTAQSLTLHLAPDPGSGTLRTRATWVFASQLPAGVEFDFAGRAESGQLTLRVFDESGAQIDVEPTDGGFRVAKAPGANRLMLEVDAPAAPGLFLPRAGGADVGLQARATAGGAPSSWLPIPSATDRVRVASVDWVLPAGWTALAPTTREPLDVRELFFAAGPWERVQARTDSDVRLWAEPGLDRLTPLAARTVEAALDGLGQRLGALDGPLDVVFLGLPDGRDRSLPGAVLVPASWLGDGRGFEGDDQRADLFGAIARAWIGSSSEVGSSSDAFWRGIARHLGDSIFAGSGLELNSGSGAEFLARRIAGAHAGAGQPGSVARAASFAHLVHRTVGDGPFLHALRSRAASDSPDAFVDALSKAADRDVAALAAPWLTGSGVPLIALESSYDAGARELVVEVSQRQSSSGSSVHVYRADVELEISSGPRIDRHLVELNARRVTVRLPLDEAPDWIAFDPSQRLPHQLATTPPRSELFARATRAPAPSSRIEALQQLATLARAATSDTTRRLLTAQLTDAVTRTGSAWVRQVAARELGTIGGLEARAVLERVTRRDASADVRATALRGLVRWAPDVALGHLSDEVFSEPDTTYVVRAAAADLFAAAEPDRAGIWLADRLTLDSPHQRLRAHLLDLWSRTGTPGARETLAGWLGDRLAAEAVRTVAARRSVEMAAPGREAPLELLAVLSDPDARWREAAIAALGRYRSGDAREALRSFAAEASSTTEARAAEAALTRY